MSVDKSSIERLLDISVYAPLGLVLTRDEAIDELALTGRKQVAFCRSLGRAALKNLARGAQSDVPSHPATKPAVQAASSALAGYDDMTAKEAIAAIATCTPAQVRWIRDREAATKQRVTVMRALDARG